jgi:hypothetical protein
LNRSTDGEEEEEEAEEAAAAGAGAAEARVVEVGVAVEEAKTDGDNPGAELGGEALCLLSKADAVP